MQRYQAVFEVIGDAASYGIFDASPEAAVALLPASLWPYDADRLRIMDEAGREALAIEQPAGEG